MKRQVQLVIDDKLESNSNREDQEKSDRKNKNCPCAANITQTEELFSVIVQPRLIKCLSIWKLFLATEAVPYEAPGRTRQRS